MSSIVSKIHDILDEYGTWENYCAERDKANALYDKEVEAKKIAELAGGQKEDIESH